MPEVEAPFQKTRPKTAFVGCRFCIDEWHVWSNTNPQTATIREHLISKHYDKFRVAVLTNKLKGWETFGHAPGARGKEREPFSLEGFYERFVRWIAVDDQSINVIDSPELRDLLLYVGTQLDEDDLPHRTKLTQLIYERFQLEFKKLIEELKNAAGRISFTSDLWTDQNRRSYMAITAHFMSFGINGQVTMTTRLVAFRYVPGSHSGQNLAKVFVAILKELGIFNRIGMVTLDNASNCGSMMEFVALLLRDMGVYFDKEGNRIRCFPHIINLAVKAGLKQLTKLLPRGSAQDQDDDGDDFECDDDPATQLDIEADDPYMEILRDDVVAAAHDLVSACRASGPRCEEFKNTIVEENASGAFGDDDHQSDCQIPLAREELDC
ncbi:putative encoded by [Lyophyllum shimeji]|uniref:Encoded by n=1 Tax=Lyophyllum shimeji TaxID=47721 RepID=A0A9P3Q1Z3_LYOSH|nr:putative encoded by [Lyophyllum shimeji]